MACRGCSRRSSKKSSTGVTEPEIVNDFTSVRPTQTRIRSGNGQQYSVLSPLVKMRPPSGWSLWVMVKGHKHFIEGDNAREIVKGIIERYATNDIEIDEKTAWFNANRVWVSRISPRHTYATSVDLNAIAESTSDPLIWNAEEWIKIKSLVDQEEYDPDKTKDELFRLFKVAEHKWTGCEVCYDELTQSPYDIKDQKFMKEWINTRYQNIVEANA